MTTVAVAGGTGGLGRAIVEALVADGKQVVILSRKMEGESALADLVTKVDYTDPSSLKETLEDHSVSTLISTLPIFTSNKAELNLVEAANASSSTKRFIPSAWGLPFTESHAAVFPPMALKLEVWNKLKETSLEYTRVNLGYFLDYWGVPKVPSYLQHSTVVLDLDNNAASIPGSGNTPVAFTHTTDVARYVTKALDLPSWQPESYVIGDKTTWNEFVDLAQRLKGVKFKVVNDSIEYLQSGRVTELPAHVPTYSFYPKEQLQGLFAVFGLWFDQGIFDLHATEGALDLNTIFPGVKPLKVEEVLRRKFS